MLTLWARGFNSGGGVMHTDRVSVTCRVVDAGRGCNVRRTDGNVVSVKREGVGVRDCRRWYIRGRVVIVEDGVSSSGGRVWINAFNSISVFCATAFASSNKVVDNRRGAKGGGNSWNSVKINPFFNFSHNLLAGEKYEECV
jgi:hypothetical protein